MFDSTSSPRPPPRASTPPSLPPSPLLAPTPLPPGPLRLQPLVPRYFEFVDDASLQALTAACPRLSLLHLVDPSTLSPARPRPHPDGDDLTRGDADITAVGFENLFATLPELEDLALDLCHNVRDADQALEALPVLTPLCPPSPDSSSSSSCGPLRRATVKLHPLSLLAGWPSSKSPRTNKGRFLLASLFFSSTLRQHGKNPGTHPNFLPAFSFPLKVRSGSHSPLPLPTLSPSPLFSYFLFFLPTSPFLPIDLVARH